LSVIQPLLLSTYRLRDRGRLRSDRRTENILCLLVSIYRRLKGSPNALRHFQMSETTYKSRRRHLNSYSTSLW